MPQYLLGTDNGCTMSKAALFTLDGREMAVASQKTETLTPKPGHLERDVPDMWRSTAAAIRQVIAEAGIDPADIACVACAGHGNGLYLIDEAGEPTRNAIMSTDSRARDIIDQWTADGVGETVRPKTAQAIWPAQPNALLLWLKRHEPEAIEKARWVLMAKDYIRFKLTGEAAAELTDFSGTSLISVVDRAYDDEVLEAFGIGDLRGLMPPLVRSADLCGKVTAQAAAKTGLAKGTPVAGGLFDIDASGLGCGILEPSQLCMIAGTWGNNQYIAPQPVLSPDVFMSTCGFYLMLEGSATSASNLEWFVTEFFGAERAAAEQRGKSVYELTNGLVAASDPDSTVLFLPFLYGSNVSPDAKAAFIGRRGARRGRRSSPTSSRSPSRSPRAPSSAHWAPASAAPSPQASTAATPRPSAPWSASTAARTPTRPSRTSTTPSTPATTRSSTRSTASGPISADGPIAVREDPTLLRIATAAALLAAFAYPAVAGKRPDPPYFVRKKTWQDTLLASREALMRLEAEEAKRPDAAPKRRPVALGTWYVIEPFYAPESKKVFDYAFPPEKELAREGGDVQAALAKAYGKLSWKPRPDLQDGVPHKLGAGGNGASYLYRTLTATKPRTITGFFGGDDGILIWLNGKLVYSEPGPRGIAPNQDKVKLRLHAGANHLLLKIPNYGGRHGFYFHTRPTPVGSKDTGRNKALDELWKHLDYVYRKETIVKHEMACERRDRIWDAAWTPGSYGELARRYAKAVRVPTLAREASALAASCRTLSDLGKVRTVYYRGKRIEQTAAQLKDANFEAIRLAIADLSATFPEHYTKGKTCLARADALERKLRALNPTTPRARPASPGPMPWRGSCAP